MIKLSFWLVCCLALVSCSPSDSGIEEGFQETQSEQSSLTPTIEVFDPSPLPTRTYAQSLLIIDDLMETNGGCELPCWWGISPGETRWEVAKRFLDQFMDVGEFERADEILVATVSTNRTVAFSEIDFITNYYFIENEIVSWMNVVAFGREEQFNLSRVLERFGTPNVMAMRTIADYGQGAGALPHPFVLDIYYLERGLLFEYSIPTATDEQDSIEACFYDIENPAIFLWNPEKTTTWEQATTRFLDIVNLAFPIELSHATPKTRDQVYENILNQQGEICLLTEKSLWP